MLNPFSLNGNVIKPAIFWLCRLIAGVRLKVKKLFPQKIKTVLLAGTSEVTVFDLLDADEIIAELGKKQSSMLVSSGTRKFAQTKLLEYGLKIPLISLPQALCTPWDIIVFADHNNTRWFHPDIPKISYGHGLTSGKTHGPGGSWHFGQNALDNHGHPLYDIMFIESTHFKNITLGENPALEGTLAVVGSLMADKLLALDQQRNDIRKKLGIGSKKPVFVIFSTWGPSSLLHRFGLAVLDQLPDLAQQYHIFLIIHPLNDQDDFPNKLALLERLKEYKDSGLAIRIEPDESWVPYLITADIVLTDHTSLSLYYTLLERPLFFVPLGTKAITHESLIWEFYKLQEPYTPDISLTEQLQQVIRNFSIEKHRAAVNLLLDERGNARERICAEIARFW